MSKLAETLLKNLKSELVLEIGSCNYQRQEYLQREITKIEKQLKEADEHETSIQTNQSRRKDEHARNDKQSTS